MSCPDPARCYCARFERTEERELHHALALDEILDPGARYEHAVRAAVKLGARAPGALEARLHGPVRPFTMRRELGSEAVRPIIERASARAKDLPDRTVRDPWPESERRISAAIESDAICNHAGCSNPPRPDTVDETYGVGTCEQHIAEAERRADFLRGLPERLRKDFE